MAGAGVTYVAAGIICNSDVYIIIVLYYKRKLCNTSYQFFTYKISFLFLQYFLAYGGFLIYQYKQLPPPLPENHLPQNQFFSDTVYNDIAPQYDKTIDKEEFWTGIKSQRKKLIKHAKVKKKKKKRILRCYLQSFTNFVKTLWKVFLTKLTMKILIIKREMYLKFLLELDVIFLITSHPPSHP